MSAVDHGHEKWLPRSSADRFDVDSLSLRSGHLLATSRNSGRLLRFDPEGRQRDVELPSSMKELQHAVETSRQTFIVCYRNATERHWGVERHWAVSAAHFCNSVMTLN